MIAMCWYTVMELISSKLGGGSGESPVSSGIPLSMAQDVLPACVWSPVSPNREGSPVSAAGIRPESVSVACGSLVSGAVDELPVHSANRTINIRMIHSLICFPHWNGSETLALSIRKSGVFLFIFLASVCRLNARHKRHEAAISLHYEHVASIRFMSVARL